MYFMHFMYFFVSNAVAVITEEGDLVKKSLSEGGASEFEKYRTLSRWCAGYFHKRSFLRCLSENQFLAKAGIERLFLENHSRIARLRQPSFENHENAVSRGWQLAQSRAVAGYRIS